MSYNYDDERTDMIMSAIIKVGAIVCTVVGLTGIAIVLGMNYLS